MSGPVLGLQCQGSHLAELQRIQRIRENYTFYLGHLVAATAVHGCARHEIGFFDLGLGSVAEARSWRGVATLVRPRNRRVPSWSSSPSITNDIKPTTTAQALPSKSVFLVMNRICTIRPLQGKIQLGNFFLHASNHVCGDIAERRQRVREASQHPLGERRAPQHHRPPAGLAGSITG